MHISMDSPWLFCCAPTVARRPPTSYWRRALRSQSEPQVTSHQPTRCRTAFSLAHCPPNEGLSPRSKRKIKKDALTFPTIYRIQSNLVLPRGCELHRSAAYKSHYSPHPSHMPATFLQWTRTTHRCNNLWAEPTLQLSADTKVPPAVLYPTYTKSRLIPIVYVWC